MDMGMVDCHWWQFLQWWWQGLMGTEIDGDDNGDGTRNVMAMTTETERGKATATPVISITNYSKSNMKWQLQHHSGSKQDTKQQTSAWWCFKKQHHDVVAVAFAQLLLHRKWQWELLQLQRHCSSSCCTARDATAVAGQEQCWQWQQPYARRLYNFRKTINSQWHQQHSRMPNKAGLTTIPKLCKWWQG